MPSPEEIDAQLSGPGGPFEIVTEPVLGEPMPVFREREPHLRAILERSAAFGDREYMIVDDGRRISFAEHAQVVASVARAFSERFGVAKGDRVAILAANCPEWIVSFWAALSLGAIPVGLNGWWAGEEIRYGVAHCDPKLLIGDRKRLARVDVPGLGVPVVEIESGFGKLWDHDPGASLPRVEIHEDDPATILYTSGTTGRPKGAVNTHRNVIALCRVQIYHGLRQLLRRAGPPVLGGANCALVTTPLFHVSGLYAGAVTLLATGIKTVWTTGRFDALAVMELIEREQVSNWGPMGTMLYRVVNHPDVGRFDLSSLRNVGSGGAPIPAELLERMRQVFPNARAQMGVGYGLTEATALATLNSGEDLERHPDSVGRPLPTIAVEIRDAEGRVLAEGEEGEIHTRSPLVMKEYWRDPRATAEAIGPGRWLRTGDIGRLREGRLYVASRKRDLILRGAENVYPVEIEHCLESHPDVREAAVVGVEHPELGQEVKAIVVPVPGARPRVEDLRRFVADRLAYFKVPAHWELRAEPLPRNATGKVLKHVLAGDAENRFVED